jgi:hypothetical protein
MTCRLSQLITKEAYDKIVHDKRRKEIQREHACLIARWGYGPEKPSKTAWKRLTAQIAREINKKPAGLGRTIGMLARWGLIKDERSKPDQSNIG